MASVQIEMPQLSSEDESEGGVLANWLVAPGDHVEKGEVIAELETEKATVELESPETGTISQLVVAAGTEAIAPGTTLATLETESDAAPRAATDSSPSPAVSASPAPSPSPAAGAVPARVPADTSTGRASTGPPASAGDASAERPSPPATPLARRAAEANAVELSHVVGTGPGGRIVEADVLRQAPAQAPGESAPPPVVELAGEADGRSIRLSSMRETIARRMTESKQQVPHFYLRMRVSMDEAIAVRARLNAGLAEEGQAGRISLNDFILRAAALALREVPEANVQFAGDAIRVFDRIDIAVAVATDGGLVTPVVRGADRKRLSLIAEEVRGLAAAARDGKLTPAQYRGGTFTISNLGMYGIETVYPILNPPQACILGVGAAEAQPVVREGEIVVGHVAGLTLAADHRAVDGAVGARLLAAIRSRLEDPIGMIL